MTLRTGRRCTWDEIKVGEVFAINTCWVIYYKISNKSCLLLSTDNKPFEKGVGEVCTHIFNKKGKNFGTIKECVYGCLIYKLPLSVQRLWKEE